MAQGYCLLSLGRWASYGSGMESYDDWLAARAALEWHIDLGATEAICDAPINRYELQEKSPKQANSAPTAPVAAAEPDGVAIAQSLAQQAQTLSELRIAIEQFEHCPLKRGARSMVFADGNPQARVMIIGEAPGRDEDMQGRPFVGRAGQMLDKMFAAIGLSRSADVPQNGIYITNVVPWRPPQNRDPSVAEIDMMLPFVLRHIALVQPAIIVAMGNVSAQALLGQRGITKLRGTWTQARGCDVLPMLHPAYLLRNPIAKRETWADLLALKQKLGM